MCDKIFLDKRETFFIGIRKVLDVKMKSLIDRGLGYEFHQADLIWTEDEEKIWQDGVLGRETVNNYNTHFYIHV